MSKSTQEGVAPTVAEADSRYFLGAPLPLWFCQSSRVTVEASASAERLSKTRVAKIARLTSEGGGIKIPAPRSVVSLARVRFKSVESGVTFTGRVSLYLWSTSSPE